MDKFKKIINQPIFSLVLRLLVGCVFIVAGVGKIADTNHFAKEITNYNLLPLESINLIALVMPWLELCSGLLLIFGVRLKANSVLISAMLIVFILAAISAIARGLDINCGCFGKTTEKKLGWEKVFENLGLLSATLLIFFSKPKSLTFDAIIESNTEAESTEAIN